MTTERKDVLRLVSELAASFRADISSQLKDASSTLRLVGFLSTENTGAKSYAEYTASGCRDVGIEFDLRYVEPETLEQHIVEANCDDTVHGILVYYPIFKSEKDLELQQLVSIEKDVEGLNEFWLSKLYRNERYYDSSQSMKAILPCTPLAVLKVLERVLGEEAPSGQTTCFQGKTVSIFNRSRVVGEPLAHMISNDGAIVHSFDIEDVVTFNKGVKSESEISRAAALASSDIVITGVPSKHFELIRADEIHSDAICLNFAGIKNFEDEVSEKAKCFVPRIGPVTVAMCLRNTLRLFKRFSK